MAYFQQQAMAKDRERFLRRALKGKDVEKEHKFWNTQVPFSYHNTTSQVACMNAFVYLHTASVAAEGGGGPTGELCDRYQDNARGY